MKQKLTTKAIKSVLRNPHSSGVWAIYEDVDGMKTSVSYETDVFIAYNYGKSWRDQAETKIQSLPPLRNFVHFLVVGRSNQITRWEYEHPHP